MALQVFLSKSKIMVYTQVFDSWSIHKFFDKISDENSKWILVPRILPTNYELPIGFQHLATTFTMNVLRSFK